MITKKITIIQVEYVAHKLAQELMTWNEPIPEFKTRFKGILESCLNATHQTYSSKQLYRGLISKSSILFYLMIKNHPFQNGNKRIAVMALLYFLDKNNHWLKINKDSLYNFAKIVASSDAEDKEEVVKIINKVIKDNLITIRFPKKKKV